MGCPLAIHVRFHADQPIHPVLGVVLKTAFGLSVFGITNRIMCAEALSQVCGEAVITCHFDNLPLMPGKYYLDLFLVPGDERDVVRDAISFEVFARDRFGTGKLPLPADGPIFMPARFTLEENARSSDRPASMRALSPLKL